MSVAERDSPHSSMCAPDREGHATLAIRRSVVGQKDLMENASHTAPEPRHDVSERFVSTLPTDVVDCLSRRGRRSSATGSIQRGP